MSRRQRIVLILGCVFVGALEAPGAVRGVSEALRGPYDGGLRAADAGPSHDPATAPVQLAAIR